MPEVHVQLPTDKLSCKRAALPPRTPAVLVSCGSFNPPTGAISQPAWPMLGTGCRTCAPTRHAPDSPLAPTTPHPAVAHMRMFDLAAQALAQTQA